MKLQGKKQNIFQLVGHIESFCKKLVLFRASLERYNAAHFSSFSELLGEEKSINFSAFFVKLVKVVMSLMIDLLTLIS